MAKQSLLNELTDLRAAALVLFQAGPDASKQKWEALRVALKLPQGSRPPERTIHYRA
jgi:hypothetical protein